MQIERKEHISTYIYTRDLPLVVRAAKAYFKTSEEAFGVILACQAILLIQGQSGKSFSEPTTRETQKRGNEMNKLKKGFLKVSVDMVDDSIYTIERVKCFLFCAATTSTYVMTFPLLFLHLKGWAWSKWRKNSVNSKQE